MKRTFRFLTMGLLAVGLLASCNKKENNGGTADGLGFKAVTEQGSGNSKTHGVLQSDGGNEWLQVQWTAGDQILVNNGSETSTFQLTSGENTTTGVFYTTEGSSFDFTTGDFTAIYPAVNAENVQNMVSGNTATFNLPATQAYLAGSFAEKSMPMVAYSNDQMLEFKNVLGGICFPLVGSGYTVTRIELTSNVDEALWGVCTTEINADGCPVNTTMSNTASNKNVITLDCGTGVDLNSATEFTIMVPPGTLESGFTLEAYNGTAKILEKTADWSANVHEDFISRNEIRVLDNNLQIIVSDLEVVTIDPTHITTNSALGIAEIEGGIPTECGIIYAMASAMTDPDNDLVIDGGMYVTSLSPATPAAAFDVNITGLTPDTESNPIIYYVRAWAKNEVGEVFYGAAIPFATRKNYTASPYNGRMPYPFTVGVGKQVYFSMGNLQYKASPETWRFAENQFDFIGADNSNISSTYDGWIDLFGWGTSGWSGSGAVAYQPYSTSLDNTDYYSGGSQTHLTGTNANADWGVYHSTGGGSVITNGGTYSWRTLQSEIHTSDPDTKEWDYLFNVRSDNYRYAKVQMISMGRTSNSEGDKYNAMIVFPDGFAWPTLMRSIECNTDTQLPALADNTDHINQLTEAEWSLLEQQGAVLLPASGLRRETTMSAVNGFGAYWSASNSGPDYGANTCQFEGTEMSTCANHYRYYGFAVRVVCPAN